MKLYFENIAPFEKRMEFSFEKFNALYYPSGELAFAIDFANQLMGNGSIFNGQNIPVHYQAIGKLFSHIANPSLPVQMGYERRIDCGDMQVDYSFQLNEDKIAFLTNYSFSFNNLPIYERVNYTAKLHVNGLIALIEAIHAFIDDNQIFQVRGLELSVFFREEDKYEKLLSELIPLKNQVFTAEVAPDGSNRTVASQHLPPDSFDFFPNDGDEDLNGRINSLLYDVAYQLPMAASSYWFAFNLKEAFTFVNKKANEPISIEYQYQEEEVQERSLEIFIHFNLPHPFLEEVYDPYGTRVGSNFVFENPDATRSPISALAQEKQLLYFLLMSLCVFENYAYVPLTFFTLDRYVDLSGIELLLPEEEIIPFVKKLNKLFPNFRFIVIAKNKRTAEELNSAGLTDLKN